MLAGIAAEVVRAAQELQRRCLEMAVNVWERKNVCALDKCWHPTGAYQLIQCFGFQRAGLALSCWKESLQIRGINRKYEKDICNGADSVLTQLWDGVLLPPPAPGHWQHHFPQSRPQDIVPRGKGLRMEQTLWIRYFWYCWFVLPELLPFGEQQQVHKLFPCWQDVMFWTSWLFYFFFTTCSRVHVPPVPSTCTSRQC